MIQVSKEEYAVIAKAMPGIGSKRTVNKYYLFETPDVVDFLRQHHLAGYAPKQSKKSGKRPE